MHWCTIQARWKACHTPCLSLIWMTCYTIFQKKKKKAAKYLHVLFRRTIPNLQEYYYREMFLEAGVTGVYLGACLPMRTPLSEEKLGEEVGKTFLHSSQGEQYFGTSVPLSPRAWRTLSTLGGPSKTLQRVNRVFTMEESLPDGCSR